MIISSDQLSARLKSRKGASLGGMNPPAAPGGALHAAPPTGCWLLFGDEPLLLDEARRGILALEKDAGADHEQCVVESGFQWPEFEAGLRAGSLFSARRIIELRFGGKPQKAAADALVRIASTAGSLADVVVLASLGALEKKDLDAPWLKAFDHHGIVVQVPEMRPERMPAWIVARMRSRGLEPVTGVAERLAELMEGNLGACAQEIEKLRLTLDAPGGGESVPVTLDDIARALCENPRFDLFALSDAALSGDAPRALRILRRLRGEGVDATLVLWALAREIRVLVELAAGAAPEALFKLRRVWGDRRGLLQRAVRRWDRAEGRAPGMARLRTRRDQVIWRGLLADAALTDRMIKGRLRGDAWQGLEGLVLGLAGVKT